MSAKTQIKTEVSLTPEQIAEAFWNLGDDEQAVFFAHLHRIAGSMLCLQMSALTARLADMDRAGDRDAWAGFETIAMHSGTLWRTAIDRACDKLKSDIQRRAAA